MLFHFDAYQPSPNPDMDDVLDYCVYHAHL
jgi:hypothetical protein